MDIRKYITKKNVIIGAVAGTAIIGGIVALIVRYHRTDILRLYFVSYPEINW